MAGAVLEPCEARTFLSAAKGTPAAGPVPANQMRVYAPHSTVRDHALAEWTQAWWQSVPSLPEIPSSNSGPNPVYENPLYDNDGSLAYLGEVGRVIGQSAVLTASGPAPQRTSAVAPTRMPPRNLLAELFSTKPLP